MGTMSSGNMDVAIVINVEENEGENEGTEQAKTGALGPQSETRRLSARLERATLG